MSFLKFDQHVHVAFRREIISQGRTKYSKSAYMMPPAKISNFVLGYNQIFVHCKSIVDRFLFVTRSTARYTQYESRFDYLLLFEHFAGQMVSESDLDYKRFFEISDFVAYLKC